MTMTKTTLHNQNILEKRDTSIDNLYLTYTLFRSAKKASGRYVYSVEISIFDGDNTESNFVFDISRLKGRAKDIFDLLYENCVTPCTLKDVLEDIL